MEVPMSDEQKKLDAELRKLGQTVQRLSAEGERLREAGRILDELNSSFPDTKEFLEARGLTKVSQLDEQGREELTDYLTKKLHELRPPN
jgi:hypothetical protein